MEIKVARELGFCFGVRRAIDLLETTAQNGHHVMTFGPVVHNPQVVEGLAIKGVRAVDALSSVSTEMVGVTAHGVGPSVIDEMKRRGLNIVDATCPIVAISQKAAKSLVDDGYFVVLYGDARHREVRGVLGWTEGRSIATTSIEDLEAMGDALPKRLALLSQTTNHPRHFASFVNAVLDRFLERLDDVQVVSTLCNATSKQQEAALELAEEVELMIVVGGRSSANTRHLAELAAAKGVETHHIETADELRPVWLAGKEHVGITAGASTPDAAINAAVARLRELASALNAVQQS